VSHTDAPRQSADLVIVANRLPVDRVDNPDGTSSWRPSPGGLVTALEPVMRANDGAWIGWPGGTDTDLDPFVENGLSLVPVSLSASEIEEFYEGFSNATLWPLYHDVVAKPEFHREWFDSYVAVNRRFAEKAAAVAAENATVWVHDYQLMLVPQMLRDRIPGARIGFFLHIPFPSSEIFRILPQRERVLEGLLGADVLGFHAPPFVRHFASAALRLAGAATEVDHLRWQGRDVALGVFPMGVDAAHLGEVAGSREVEALAASHRARGVRLLVGVDRLDYTKGISRRLLAFEALLRAHPELRERVALVQVAVPSRENVFAYRELREEVDALVGRIHGEHATTGWSPIQYLHRSLSEPEIVALYRAADAVVVTPLRDGMNLVAKEFVASRVDGDGVLVLSEFAGAAQELSEALHVNPYDVERTAEALHRALVMPEEERRTRFAAYADRLRQRFGRAQRLELVERMWSVAFGDGAIGAQEARVMTVAAELLGLTPAEVAEVRRRVRGADRS